MSNNYQLKYENVYDDLLKKINDKELLPNQKLPSETDLAKEYNVSRVTIRQSLKKLENDNYLVRVRGKGTFIKGQTHNKELSKIVSFSRNCLMSGNIPSNKIISFEKQKTSLIARNFLDANDEDIYSVRRIRYANGLEVIYEESYWLESVCRGISRSDIDISIIGYMEKIGTKPIRVKQEFIALKANKELSDYLSVEVGFPLLKSTMTFYNQDNRAVALSISYYRTDRMVIIDIRDIEG